MGKRENLEALRRRMEKDESLPLRTPGTNLVFGDGNPEAEILFIGEGPGYWENEKGVPFVGNAGALLNRLLHLIKLPRESVYITNVVHHRPPGNRDPLPEEIDAYQKYLNEMIQIIKPRVVVTLGRYSMAKFLPHAKISSVHGKSFPVEWQGLNMLVVPMYHPAAALRNGAILRQIQSDFLLLPGYLDAARDLKIEKKTTEKEKNPPAVGEQMELL